MVFDRFNPKASSSCNLVHSYSTSAIVKNPLSNFVTADPDTTTSNLNELNFCQEGNFQLIYRNFIESLNFNRELFTKEAYSQIPAK